MKSYKELETWKRAMNMVETIYAHTANFPKTETFGMTTQMRRAAVSVASNIAEGRTRNSTNEYIHFLYYAKASVSELETQVIIGQRLKYVEDESASIMLKELDEIARMIGGLIKALNQRRTK